MVLVFMCSFPRIRFRPDIGTACSRHRLPKDESPPLLLWLHSDVMDYMDLQLEPHDDDGDTATVTIVTYLRFMCRVTRLFRRVPCMSHVAGQVGDALHHTQWCKNDNDDGAGLCFMCDGAAPPHSPQELLLQWCEPQV